jgi:hypothetical protein
MVFWVKYIDFFGEDSQKARSVAKRQNEANVNLDIVCGLSGRRLDSEIAGGKIQNEANVSLGKIYRLSETRIGAAIVCAKSQDEPNVNLSRLYELR